MTFSSTVAQQREKQAATLKQFISYSLLGSLTLHGLGLLLKVAQPVASDEIVSEEITIVVTEPPVESSSDEVAIAAAPQQETAPNRVDSIPTSQVSTAPTATVVETPVEMAPPQDTLVEEPEPRPSPIAEAVVPETITEETPTETVPEETAEAIAERPVLPPRSLRDLLNDLRQSQQSSNAEANLPLDANSIGELGVFNPDQFSRPGTTEEPTTAVGSTSSPGIIPGTETTGNDARSNEATGESQGSRSREITCQGCSFDYPDEANGAEGQAQVIVETDEQGRVVSVTLSRSSGNAALDRAAIQQARQRVRLNNARAGESYPLEIDFVQPNSDAARRARTRGDRRSITVADPEPTLTESPALANPPTQVERIASPENTPQTDITNSPQPSPSENPVEQPGDRSPSPVIEAAPSPSSTSSPDSSSPSPSRDSLSSPSGSPQTSSPSPDDASDPPPTSSPSPSARPRRSPPTAPEAPRPSNPEPPRFPAPPLPAADTIPPAVPPPANPDS